MEAIEVRDNATIFLQKLHTCRMPATTSTFNGTLCKKGAMFNPESVLFRATDGASGV